MSRAGSRGVSFIAFVLVASVLSVILDYALHQVWLERAGIVPQAGGSHYFALFIIVFLLTLVFSQMRVTARPIVIGFIAALMMSVYVAANEAGLSIADAALMFFAHFLAVLFAVGLADGFVKGYGLKGVRA